MNLRLLVLAISALANAALVAAFVWRPTLAPSAFRAVFSPDRAAGASPAPAPAPRVERAAAPKKLWPLLESDDPATLVARLRAAGFPAAIIREVVRAHVAARFDTRLRALLEPDPNAPFWKQPPGFLIGGSPQMEEYTRLQRERAKLLRELLADPFFGGEDATPLQRRLYGNLSPQKIDAVRRIEEDYAEMTAAIRSAAQGVLLKTDRDQLAFLEQEKRADLARVLSAEELAEHQMRASPLTRMLARELGDFRPTDAEFRAIFAMQQELNEKFPASPGAPASNAERRAAQQQLDERLRAQMGDARYAEFQREVDRDFQQLKRLAQRDNLPADAAVRAYAVRDTVAQESTRIARDPALSVDDKRTALAGLAQTTRNQLLAILGPTAGPSYVATLDNQWLNALARGMAVTFDGAASRTVFSDNVAVSLGRGPNYRSVGPVNPPPR